MRLLGYLNLTGVMTCETGLLIGGNDSFGIGGIDKAMIRQSFKGNQPYIPGSSLKGKMRHLLEQSLNKVRGSEVHSCKRPDCPICHIFGAGKTEDAQTLTRLVVRDAKLIVAAEDAPVQARAGINDYVFRVAEFQRQHGSYVEIKTENYINRKTGAAVAPRRFERVPAGMKFAVDLVYRAFAAEGDEAKLSDLDFFANVAQALHLVGWEYVGASGSRGYGRVAFSELQLTFTDARTGNEVTTESVAAADLRKWKPSAQLVAAVDAATTANSTRDETSGGEPAEGNFPAPPAELPTAAEGEMSNEG